MWYKGIFVVVILCGCIQNNEKEGFNKRAKKINYSINRTYVKDYPEVIDVKVLNEKNINFSDSLKNKKIVCLKKRIHFFPRSKKVRFVDTVGYSVLIRNDQLELVWELDFDKNMKIERSEEITYEEEKFYLEEGQEILKNWEKYR